MSDTETPAEPVITDDGFELVEEIEREPEEEVERPTLADVDPNSIVLSHDPDLQDEQAAALTAVTREVEKPSDPWPPEPAEDA